MLGERPAVVRFSSQSTLPVSFLLRQFPKHEPRWGPFSFRIGQNIPEPDFWVVYDDLSAPEFARCDPRRTVLFIAEPSSVRAYSPGFLKQFGLVVAAQQGLEHANVLHSQPGLPWMVGWRFPDDPAVSPQSANPSPKDWDFFSGTGLPAKTRDLSLITSAKRITEGHARRFDFAMSLKQHFGDRLDLFGAGLNPIEDKWDALAPYRYTVSIENSCFPHYWTEKLSDPLLTGTLPFYFGCPNLDVYFPERTVIRFDLNDVPGSIATIERALLEDVYSSSLSILKDARRLILQEYQLFALIARVLATKFSNEQSHHKIRLYPERRFRDPWRWRWSRVRRRLKKT